ncbi:MAG: RpoL/Rpb11 RNA polymerase subunit family protein [Candidatus Woesearchaeota archaeon]
MECTIIEEKKNLLVADLDDVSHELCLAIQQECYNDDAVTIATYRMEHPLLRKARIYLETKNKDAKTALKEALKRIEKTNKKMMEMVDKAL